MALSKSFLEHMYKNGEEYRAAMVEAAARAAEVREAWTVSVANGEQSFDSLMTLVNRPGSKDGKYASKIKLYDILRLAKGWTDERAYQALVENGMDHKTNVAEARLYIPFYERFRELISTHGEEWEPSIENEVVRPEMPAGWPWYSKLDGLMVLDGADAYPLPSSGKTDPSDSQETPSTATQWQFDEFSTEGKGGELTDAQRAFEEELMDDELPLQPDTIEDVEEPEEGLDNVEDGNEEFDYDAALRSFIDDDDDEDGSADELARILGV